MKSTKLEKVFEKAIEIGGQRGVAVGAEEVQVLFASWLQYGKLGGDVGFIDGYHACLENIYKRAIKDGGSRRFLTEMK